MANNLELKAVITAEDKASQTISGFGKTSVAAFGAIAGIAQSVTTKAIDAVTASVGDAVKRVDTLNNAGRVFANMGYSAGDVKVAMDGLNKSILGLPTSLDQAVSGMQMIASTTGDIGKAQKIFSALNDAVIGFGGSAADVQGAILQLSQAFSNGRIDAQTWNSLMQNNLGPTLNAIAKDMGITTGQLKQGLSDGTISVQRFQDALIKLDTQGGGGLKSLQNIAHDATAGIATGIENAKTAMTRGIADIIKAIGPENLSGAITKLGAILEDVFKKVADFIKFMESHPTLSAATLGAIAAVILSALVPALLSMAAAIGANIVALAPFIAAGAAAVLLYEKAPIVFWAVAGALVGFATAMLVSAIPAIVAAIPAAISATIAFGAMAVAVIAATWPFIVIGGAVAVAAYLIITHWNNVKGVVQGGAAAIVGAVEWVKNVFASLPGIVQWAINTSAHFILNMLGPLGQVIALVDNLRGKISSLANANPGNIGGLLHNLHVPGFASGVQNFGGGLAVVGERGPELVNLPRGSSVIPNNQIGSGGVTNVNVTFTGPMMGNASEAREFARNIANALNDLAGSKNQSVMEYLA